MAMLNKLVFILGKLDPDNIYWKKLQKDKAILETEKAYNEGNKKIRHDKLEKIEKTFNRNTEKDYGRKLYLIEKCIYGVDIQQIAVEIAKLRFFISLLVDEKIDFDKPEANYGIEPLPNLDFKLMQGNSLISTFAGIDFNETETKAVTISIDLDDPAKKLIKKFEDLKNEYLNVSEKEEKDRLLENIEETILNIFEEKINEHIPQLKIIEEKYATLPNKQQREKAISEEKQKLTKKLGFDIEEKEKDLIAYTEGRKPKEFFLWNLYFAEVFTEKGGFDVVIGNPPYIQLQKDIGDGNSTKYADLYINCGYETFKRTGDIYALFYEKGIHLLKKGGHLTYITSNKWMRAGYGDVLRGFFAKHNPKILLDFGGFKVFESATVDVNIIVVEKTSVETHGRVSQITSGMHGTVETNGRSSLQKTIATHFKNDFNKGDSVAEYVKNNSVELTNLTDDTWFIGSKAEIALKTKIEEIGTPLKDWDVNIYRGVLTGYNKAFIINETKREELIAQDPKSENIIKPILRGRDIKRYSYEFAGLYLIDSHNGYPDENGNRITPINIDDYPAVKEHLDQHWDKISVRQDKGVTPYNLRNCAYYPEFAKEKVVWKRIGSILRFSFDNTGCLALDSNCILTGEKTKFIAAVLNSKVGLHLLQDSPKTGTGDLIISVQAIDPILVPPVTASNRHLAEQIEALVELRIKNYELRIEKNTDAEIEQEIDRLVYKLYGLTYDEVKIVDPDFSLSKENYEKRMNNV